MLKKQNKSLIIILTVLMLLSAPVAVCRADDQQLQDLADPTTEPQQQRSSDSVEQQTYSPQQPTFERASGSIREKLEQSIAEYNRLCEKVAEEKIPLSRKLSELEAELTEVRKEYQQTARLLDSRTLSLTNLRSEIKTRREESTYLSNLLGEYARNFESRLHIAEIQRYEDKIEEARLAPENSNLSEKQVYQAQAMLLSLSLDRLHEALGGTSFTGSAVDDTGLVKLGTFTLVGPSALFRSQDGEKVGTAEQRLGSLEPAIIPFAEPEDILTASEMVKNLSGQFPLDPTLGNAHKIAETNETLLSHIQKGGPVMYPIFTLAGLALLVALIKWVSMMFIRTPSKKRVDQLLESVGKHDIQAAEQKAKKMKGPVGKMLTAAVEHIKEPTELIEEVMYEKVLTTRLKLEKFLPFISITAASAPLLGLLGTVTGIINTFKLITVFGSGDVKTLSGGISEALITTEFGLIVAIPSLLLHAFLSRKAKGVINHMEKTAVAFVNQVSKHPFAENTQPSTDVFSNLTAQQFQNFVKNMSAQKQNAVKAGTISQFPKDSAGAYMNRRVLSVEKNATVGETINRIRKENMGREIDSVYIVDKDGKYVGHALVRHLLTQPENSSIESLTEKKPLFVRTDTHKNDVINLFRKHDLVNIPVLDHQDKLVGRVTRNGNGKK